MAPERNLRGDVTLWGTGAYPWVEVELSSLTDETLMERVQHGDRAAYQELFERYQRRIYGYLLRKTRDPQATDDLFQETFLSVYRSRNTWKPGRNFRSWLFAIAANASRDFVRKQQRTPEEADAEILLPVYPRSDARIHLEEAIAGLPDTLRDAFLLGVVEGFTHKEVASQLGITPANARARISRARAWLREHLEGGR